MTDSPVLPPRVVLASGSRYRRELLERLGLDALAYAPNIDESIFPGETTEGYVQRLAIEKATRAFDNGAFQADLSIGSDQSACLDGERLVKPGNFARTVTQLERASGRQITFWTSIAVLSADGSFQRVDAIPSVVRFRTLTRHEIERYVEAEQPFDCAGGFKAEGLGIALFESLESQDPTALIGLPLIRLAQRLREFGFQIP